MSPDDDNAEKSFSPAAGMHVITEPPHTRRGPNFFVKLIGWPAFVILGQLTLQAFGWAFFGIVRKHGQLALPLRTVHWIQGNQHSVTLVVTLIATILAAFSSFLFSYAIRRSLSLYLYRPMSLRTLGASVNIAARSLIFQRRTWRWPIASVFILLIAGIQTSGWTTLLTPVSIVITTPLAGSEVDLSSAFLKQIWAANTLLDGSGGPDIESCVQTVIDLNYNALFTDLSESGLAAAQSHFGAPTNIRLMNQTFNESTKGIMPAFMNAVNVSTWLWHNDLVLPTVRNLSGLPEGLVTNYSTVQQGYTADVSCAWQNLSTTTTLSLNESSSSITGWDDSLGSNFKLTPTYYQIFSTCPMDGITTKLNVSDGYTSYQYDNSYLLMVACKLTDRYAFLFVPRGHYSPWSDDWDAEGVVPTLTCSLAPKLSTVRVDYTDIISTTVEPSGEVVDLDGPGALSAAFTMAALVGRTQSLSGSTVADQWMGMLAPQDFGSPKTLELVEQYVKGVVEYSGSLFRTCLSATGNGSAFGAAGLPANLTIATSGTHYTETIGWKYGSAATRWVLVPGTLLAAATILVTLIAIHRHQGAMPNHSFDPSDPLHLMGAAAAGDLSSAFREMGLHQGTDINVVLGWIPDRGPALLRTDAQGQSPLSELPFFRQ